MTVLRLSARTTTTQGTRQNCLVRSENSVKTNSARTVTLELGRQIVWSYFTISKDARQGRFEAGVSGAPGSELCLRFGTDGLSLRNDRDAIFVGAKL